MTIAFREIQDAYSSFSVILFCISSGFLFLRLTYKGERVLVLWAMSAVCNAIGFALWTGNIPVNSFLYYSLGDLFHLAGFFLLSYAAIDFVSANRAKKILLSAMILVLLVWGFAVISLKQLPLLSGVILKFLRACIFIFGGSVLLHSKSQEEATGRQIAGFSLNLWALFIILSAFVKMDSHVFFGFLVGFHLLSYLGMVAMIVDRIITRTKHLEKKVQTLEGILPICSYCKKIRDTNKEWKPLEEYIEDRSKAEFSHGICPECFEKYRPDK